MATNRISIAAPPERVFEVLAVPERYPDWVVGADRIRDADPGFPAPGTKFHHTVGFGPLKLHDHTTSVASEPPFHLRLKAKARPFGIACVDLRLEPAGAGTCVTMNEAPPGIGWRILTLPLDPLIGLRNSESLRRLKRLVESRRHSGP